MTGSWLPTCAGTCAGLLYNNGWVAGCPLVQVTRAVLLYNMGTKVQGLQSKQLTASLFIKIAAHVRRDKLFALVHFARLCMQGPSLSFLSGKALQHHGVQCAH